MCQPIVPDDQPPGIMEAGEGAVHLPAMPVVGDVRLAAKPWALALPLWDARFDSTAAQPAPESLAVVSPVRHQLPGAAARPASRPWGLHRSQGRLSQSDLFLLGAGHQPLNGYPLIVRQQRYLGSFALAGKPYSTPLFLGGAKVAPGGLGPIPASPGSQGFQANFSKFVPKCPSFDTPSTGANKLRGYRTGWAGHVSGSRCAARAGCRSRCAGRRPWDGPAGWGLATDVG